MVEPGCATTIGESCCCGEVLVLVSVVAKQRMMVIIVQNAEVHLWSARLTGLLSGTC